MICALKYRVSSIGGTYQNINATSFIILARDIQALGFGRLSRSYN